MDKKKLTPLFALAVSIAYLIEVDDEAGLAEKAGFLALFSKLVGDGTINQNQLERLTKDAFNYAKDVEIDEFLATAAPLFSHPQRLALMLNLFDLMLVDGGMKEGERDALRKFQRAFNIDGRTMLVAREVLGLKNDISLFVNPLHPREGDDYDLLDALRRALD